MGEVAEGRARRRRTVVFFAKAQLEGGVASEEGSRWFICQKCGDEVHVKLELDPCAFCNDCKDEVLDMLAEAVVNATKRKRRHRG